MTLLFLQKIIVLLKINTSVIIDWKMYSGIKYFVFNNKVYWHISTDSNRRGIVYMMYSFFHFYSCNNFGAIYMKRSFGRSLYMTLNIFQKMSFLTVLFFKQNVFHNAFKSMLLCTLAH